MLEFLIVLLGDMAAVAEPRAVSTNTDTRRSSDPRVPDPRVPDPRVPADAISMGNNRVENIPVH